MKQFLCLVFVAAALVARAADEFTQISLWTNGAPGFEDRRNEPELAQSYWVRNIHNPSITVFLPPKDKANGAAVLICPGGGHKELVFKAEGVEAAQYFNSIGVTAFALKYRLGRETNSPYSVTKNAREDGQRAMRLIRSRAVDFGIDTNRLGIVGFSAGGEVASMVVFNPTDGDPNATDPIDRFSCRPQFQIMIYPGSMGMPEIIPSNAPPAFFLSANDDQGPARLIASILPKYRAANIPVEVHLYSKGGHAFNMGNRSKLVTLKTWPERVTAWMADNSLLDRAVVETKAVK